MAQYIFDVDNGNFQQSVIDASMNAPVLVDFWAEWCGPCKALGPILEKLAAEYQGRFILAKIDADRNQGLAGQFGVKSIPTVKVVYRGEIVDEFSGALPESALREFIDGLIPSAADALRMEAGARRDAGDLDGALDILGQASQADPNDQGVRLDAAEILADLDRLDEARQLLATLGPDTMADDRAARLRARLDFALSGAAGNEAELRQRLAAEPDDMDTRLSLANLLVASARYAEGMDELLEMVRRDRAWNEETARKTLLSVFSLLGADPLVAQYRRKLSSALN